MKVVHVIPSLSRGGAERFVVDLCNALVGEVEVYVVSLYANRIEDTFLNELSSDVNYSELHKKSGIDLSIIFKLEKLIKAIEPNVVHTHLNAFEYVLPLVIRKKYTYFHTVHNDAFVEAGSRMRIAVRKYFFSKGFITPITISQQSRESFQKAYGRQDIDRLIFNGAIIHPSKNAKSTKEFLLEGHTGKIFLNVARINKQKNQLSLAKAFLRFNAKYNNQHVLVIIGEIQSDEINAALQQLDTNSIRILGAKANVGDYYGSADAFILSSIYEGLPISLLESMAFGCVPISTAVGGIVDLITDGENGILAPETGEEDILKSLERFAALNVQEIEQMSKRVRDAYNTCYSMTICSEYYLKAYKRG